MNESHWEKKFEYRTTNSRYTKCRFCKKTGLIRVTGSFVGLNDAGSQWFYEINCDNCYKPKIIEHDLPRRILKSEVF